jgi:asparagine synthase (glutamine-hydrolysing)
MCGISGVIGSSDITLGRKLLSKLSHRGPDSDGMWKSADHSFPVVLCHTRLAILDLSKEGHQPFKSECGRYIFVFNGEIYNYLELRKELESEGLTFHSDTDTEVLMKGLIKYGPDFQQRCNGMWAFCLWDNQANIALLGRDRFGIKPLFFTYLDSSKIAFASEIKALTSIMNKVSPSSEISYFFDRQFQYESTQSTVIENVRRVQSGCYVTISNYQVKSYRWWNTLDHISFVDNSYGKQLVHWRELFLDSVAIRMRSDVAVGTALSGGLDSSAVAAMMNSISLDPSARTDIQNNCRKGFCASYPDSSIDESRWASLAATSCGIDLSIINVNPLDCYLGLYESMAQVEDPYHSLPLPMLQTYRAIKRSGISVTLDGHGADELFSGYGRLIEACRATKSRALIREIISIDESTRTGVFSDAERLKTREYAYHLLQNLLHPIRLNISRLKADSKYSKYTAYQEYIEQIDLLKVHPVYQQFDVFTKILYEQFHLSILPTLLRNYDRYSMASGLEIRMPFMDWRLVAYTFGLPWTSKIGGSFTKRIQRDSVRGILDSQIVNRRDKIGWNAPVHEWLNGPLLQFTHSVVNSDTAIELYGNKLSIEWNKFQSIRTPTFHDGYSIWNKIMPVAWLKCLETDIWR